MGPLSALIKFSKEGPGHDEGRAQELDVPAYRDIVLALGSRRFASLAVQHFLEYLKDR